MSFIRGLITSIKGVNYFHTAIKCDRYCGIVGDTSRDRGLNYLINGLN